jgi:hypothetical protein
MPQAHEQRIREVLLQTIESQRQHTDASSLQSGLILDNAARALNARDNSELQVAILTQWYELFRTGLLAWGLNISNPNPPFFHFTEHGREALSNWTRDPSNPAGYLRHLNSVTSIDPIAMSYLSEALNCYVGGFFKASAVMVGCAAERTILGLRDLTLQKLTALGKPVPPKMKDWKIRTVSDALHEFFHAHVQSFKRDLQEWFEAYWSAFTQQIRATRNDAGHPVSIDPVTPDTVHASLLIFPELAKLTAALSAWVSNELK